MCVVAGFSFSALSTSGPLILGIIMSSKTISGSCSLAIRNASSPSAAVLTKNPALDKTLSVMTRRNLLSSTSSTFDFETPTRNSLLNFKNGTQFTPILPVRDITHKSQNRCSLQPTGTARLAEMPECRSVKDGMAFN